MGDRNSETPKLPPICSLSDDASVAGLHTAALGCAFLARGTPCRNDQIPDRWGRSKRYFRSRLYRPKCPRRERFRKDSALLPVSAAPPELYTFPRTGGVGCVWISLGFGPRQFRVAEIRGSRDVIEDVRFPFSRLSILRISRSLFYMGKL